MIIGCRCPEPFISVKIGPYNFKSKFRKCKFQEKKQQIFVQL